MYKWMIWHVATLNILFMYISVFSQTQYTECINIESQEYRLEQQLSVPFPDFTPLDTLKTDISYYIINKDDGTGGVSIDSVIQSVARINATFNLYLMKFNLKGIYYINSTHMFNGISGTVVSSAKEMGIKGGIRNMCILVNNRLPNAAGSHIDGFIVIPRYNILKATVEHETGHLFGLKHTHGDGSVQELVNGSNCHFAGDGFCDTPAEPYNDGDGILNFVNHSTCTFSGIQTDPNGHLFQPDIFNLMSYGGNCRNKFSQMQKQKIWNVWFNTFKDQFTTAVNISNRLSDGQQLLSGNVKVRKYWEVMVEPDTLKTVNSGDSVEYYKGINMTLYAGQQLLNSTQHLQWDDSLSQYKTKHVRTISVDGSRVVSYYGQLESSLAVTAKLDNLDIPGSVYFSDPWFIESDGTQPGNWKLFANGVSSVTLPNGGLFTDISFDPLFPQNPCYKIKADLTQSGIISTFLNWSDNHGEVDNINLLETTVTFKTGSIIHANYKASLASLTAGWVTGNQFVSNTGTASVIYKSDGKLWLHRENGTDWKEIKVSDNGGSITSYSVTPNGNDRYWVTVNGTTTATWGSEVSGSVYGGILTLAAVPSAGIDLVRLSSTKLAVIYKDGSTIRYHIGTISGTTVSWAGSLSLTGMSDPIQVSTNNSTAYITWLHGSTILSYKLTAGGASTMKTVCYSSSGSFSNLASMCTPGGSLELLARRTNTSTSRKELIETAWYTNNTTKPLTVLAIADTYGDYQPLSYVSEGTKKLGVVKSTNYVPYYSNSLWRHNGTEWLTTLSYPSTDQKLMQGEVDNYPAEITHSSGLKLLQPTAVSWPAPGTEKITAGTDGYTPTLSVAFMNPADTIAWYIDLNPESVDSIRVKPSGQWIIYTNWLENRVEILNDLKQTGRATWVDSTKTIVFVPDTLRYDFWVVDPSGNKVRAGKLSGATERKTLEFEDEVSVHPNPFNPETSIRVHLAGSNQLKIRIFNVLGQLVATLADGSFDIGEYQFRFNGNSLSSGTYFYRVEIGEATKTGKLQLMK